MTPDMKARIEKAARETFECERNVYRRLGSLLGPRDWEDQPRNNRWLKDAEDILRAAFPEILAGTHWIAPMDATEAMDIAGYSDIEDSLWGDRRASYGVDGRAAKVAFAAMRTAYLNQKDSEG